MRNQANSKTEDIEGRIVELEKFIETEQKVIDDVNEEKFGYEKEYRKLEAEVGPIKYIAEFIYGEQADTNLLEAAVRWVIIIIIFVFDPLAVLLLIASQYTFNWNREDKGGKLPPKPEPDLSPEEPQDPLPSFSDEEWDEAHRENEAWDRARYEELRAEKIDNNVPPTLSKKKTDQYLLWSDVDPDPVEPKQTIEEEKYVDPNQQELDFDKEPEVPGNDLEKWNEWVEAANKAAAENPELDDDDDLELEDVSPEEKAAMQKWKSETGGSLKIQKWNHKIGKIKELPWMQYLEPQPDFVEDNKFQIMPELEKELRIGKPIYTEVVESEEEVKKKKELLNWMEKEGNQQIKKSKEVEE